MRFLHLVLILFLLAVLSASARLVEKQEAETALHAFLSERLGMSDGWSDRGAVAGELREIRRDGRLLGYWSDIQPRGHVILSPITEMPAIKAWSDSDDFEPGRSGYSELILDALSSSLDFLEDNYGDLNSLPAHVAPAGNRQSWENLLAGRPMAGNRNSVGPLLTSTWNQSYPYYLDCPPGDGGTCLVGCVATAAAQILNYWKYPEYGSGSHTYTWDGDDSCGGVPSSTQLTATFEDPYDWDNILDSYSGGNSQAERDAVAELNYEVAVAYEMNFGVCGSGAYVYTGETVFPGFFRYAETTDFINRNTHSASEWWDRLKTEFDALPPRPIAYRIHTHAIIADGYQDGSTQYYHMNYGWGGSANAWYALDNLYCPWDGCNYMVEAMLIGIEPENFFSVTEPVAGTTWVHGDALSLIEWWGSSSDNVRLLLFRGTDFVEDLSGWTANDGSELLSGEVLATWGTGSNYRVKVLDEDNHFGWSGEFSVFAPS
ncbi:MAG: C10 family peptidase, partial [Candidatus Krumholzibacteria bacterium]|nr:C10 family peptidase [Candidatus Krumholzibacteria bacterium]